jgi:hypothetical protein
MTIEREERTTCVWRIVIFGQQISVMFHDEPPSLLVLQRLIEELQDEKQQEMERRGLA